MVQQANRSSVGRIALWAVLISLVAGWWFGLSAYAMLLVALAVVAVILLWPFVATGLVYAAIAVLGAVVSLGGWIARGLLWMTGHDISKYKDGPDPEPTDAPGPQ